MHTGASVSGGGQSGKSRAKRAAKPGQPMDLEDLLVGDVMHVCNRRFRGKKTIEKNSKRHPLLKTNQLDKFLRF